jgi:hypothetical protein
MHSPNDVLIQLIPVTIAWIVVVIFGYFIARRKGVGTFGIVLGSFPLWAGAAVLWWASLTDKDVLERLNRLGGGDSRPL